MLMDYLTVQSAYHPVVIPGHNRWTCFSKLTGIPQLWTLDESGDPRLVMETEDRILNVKYAPQGNRAVIGMDHHGNEKQQLYIMHLVNPSTSLEVRTGSLVPLVQSLEHFHHIGGWSPDGRLLSYSSNRRNPAFFDIDIIDVDSRETRTLFQYDGNCVPLSWVDQDHLLIRIQETNLDNGIYLLDIHSDQQIRLGSDSSLARYESILTADQGRSGYVLTDAGEEALYIAKFDWDQPQHLHKLLAIPGWDIEEIALTADQTTLAFTVNQDGISKLGLLRPDTGEREMIEVLPEGVVDSLSWLNDYELIFALRSPVMPGDIWQYNRLNKELVRLTRIGHSDTVGSYWKQPQLHRYDSFDELSVPYFLYDQQSVPDGEKSAVIYVHGGPEGQTKAEYHPVMQYLVHQGFVVAAPNVRGSSGYGRTYIQLDDARKRMDSVQDLAWLVKALIRDHGVHPRKIGIMGRSYGGFMVLAAITHYPKLWAAGVDIVGISNLKTLLQNTGAWRRRLREYEYGSLAEHSDFFDEIAPLHHTANITAPLLVFHGRNDTRVPVSEAEQLVDDMKKRQQQVELIVFEDEGHQTERLENHITMHRKTVEFFNNHLR
ncbi:peptidase S9 [Paenibacillus bovis]|uniref:Peptidase S9 n=2 Tax=Paenibacillus bovis TaxID=1616788 RepID=A0A172ZMM5_9BACL|nr:peptidase S9 [Paenibacillus bovis]